LIAQRPIPRTAFRLASAALAALISVLASGCGGSGTPAATSTAAATTSATAAASTTTGSSADALTPKQRYEHAMQALGSSLGASLRLAGEIELASAGTKVARSRDANALENAQVALRSAAVALARIVPPPGVRSEHALLIKGVAEYANELDGVIAALRAGATPGVVLQRILAFKGVRDMERASIQLQTRGYNISAG
jgi:hypothetical protein